MAQSSVLSGIELVITDTKEEKSLSDYLAILRRRIVPMVSMGLGVLAISLAIALGLPPVYQSSATIVIEQQKIPEDLVRSTVTSYAEQRIDLIGQQVMTSTNLTKIIDKYKLYEEQRAEQPMEVVLDRMREDIGLEMVVTDVVNPTSGKATQVTIAFKLSYQNRVPQVAQNVANELVSLYLDENIRNRTESALEATDFLDKEAERLAAEIAEIETRLAEFKELNVHALPELTQLNLQLMERAEQDLIEVEREIRTLTKQRIYLVSELAQVAPQGPVYSVTGQRVLSSADRLKALQTELVSATARYGPDHPDIVKLRKEIEAFKRETGAINPRSEIEVQLSTLRSELASMHERYSDDHPDVKRLIRSIAGLQEELKRAPASTSQSVASSADNPAYLQLQARLNAADSEVAALKARAQELRERRASYETRLTGAPQVEREYKVLTRDYEVALAKHREVAAKQMEARLSHSLETSQKGERFTLIEPPLLPEKPAKPNRYAIAALGLVLALGSGLGTAALAEAMDVTVQGIDDVVGLLGSAPLAVIPTVETANEIRRQRIARFFVFAGLFAGVYVVMLLFHLLVMPLDVLWYVGLRKLGL